jgi:RNA polymerase sigma-70 factor (ECF subfamily)
MLLLAPLAACGQTASTPPRAVSTAARGAPPAAALDPPDGASGVDPSRTTLSATFDREMDRDGWAWVVESPATAPELGTSSWDASGRINTVAAKLAPGRSYVVWINSPQFAYFRDRAGSLATPRRWTFSTAGVAAAAPGDAQMAPIAAHATGPPRVIAFEPPNGASAVDPGVAELRVSFDRPMSEGWSWVIESEATFPRTTGEGSMAADRRSAVLPVRLEPGRTYVVWLNSEKFRDFRDAAGIELAPVRWTFTTRASG